MQELPPISTPPPARPPRRRPPRRAPPGAMQGPRRGRWPAWARRGHPLSWLAVALMLCVLAWPLAAMRWGDQNILARMLKVPAWAVMASLAWLAEHLGAELRVVAWAVALALPLFVVVFLAVGAAIKVFGSKPGE